MFEATATDLELDCEKDHPPSEVSETVLDSPSLADASSPDISKGLIIEYAPDLEHSFTVNLLHQFRSDSVCTCIAVSSDERYFAVGGNRKIYICRVNSGDEVMRLETDVQRPSQEDPDDYIRDLSFTGDDRYLIGATDSGRIMVCCPASTSGLATRIRQKS